MRPSACRYLRASATSCASEAVPGALPEGQNAPQKPPRGLYTEQMSGTAFTAPRGDNRRSWLYRIRPSAMHPPFRRIDDGLIRTAPFDEAAPPPNRLRWNPLPFPDEPADFVDGLVTMGGNGDAARRTGIAIHLYRATRSMSATRLLRRRRRTVDRAATRRAAARAPSSAARGRPRRDRGHTARGQIPRRTARRPRRAAMSARITARCSACPNWARSAPTASPTRVISSPRSRPSRTTTGPGGGRQVRGQSVDDGLDHSPLDVVAWHGNYAPYKYDLARFNTIGTVSFDQPDPSIFTVLTSPSEVPGTANCDFVIFPPRWLVAEHTFRPPGFTAT